ncbi:MAG: PLP-dependent aminotransferase family protein [Verrucomicrobiales bacterium]|nr:PLP-dependent aminotransferase family protein [Verrucomicrobiales bacterium]
MNWPTRYSQSARMAKRSAIRELLKLTARPDMISFAGGLPAPELFPVEEVRDACVRVLTDRPSRSLQYGESEGFPELREWIALRESRGGVRVDPGQVLITQGAQQALDLVGRCLLDRGEVAWVEDPTYLALLTAWRGVGAGFAPCATGPEGWTRVKSGRAFGRPPRVFYANPNFQNPTGATWTRETRRRVVEQARAEGVALVEDDPYGDLGFQGDTPPSLWSMDAERAGLGRGGGNVVRIGTFSKVLAPGLRLGWVVAPEEVVERMVAVRQGMDLHPGTLAQSVVWELVQRGTLERQVPRLRTAYQERCEAMIRSLEEADLPGVTWNRPEGGMFLWVRLAEGECAEKLLRRALEVGVAFVPGAEFWVEQKASNTLRLNYSHTNPERIREGVRRLSSVIRAG